MDSFTGRGRQQGTSGASGGGASVDLPLEKTDGVVSFPAYTGFGNDAPVSVVPKIFFRERAQPLTGVSADARTGGPAVHGQDATYAYDGVTEYILGPGIGIPEFAFNGRWGQSWRTGNVYGLYNQPLVYGIYNAPLNVPFPGVQTRPSFMDADGVRREGPYITCNFGAVGPLYADEVLISWTNVSGSTPYLYFPRRVSVYGAFSPSIWTKIGERSGMIQPSSFVFAGNWAGGQAIQLYPGGDSALVDPRPLYGIRLVILESGGGEYAELSDVRFVDTLERNLNSAVAPPKTHTYDLGTDARRFRNVYAKSLFLDEETLHIGNSWSLGTDLDQSGSKRLKLTHFGTETTSHVLAHPTDGVGATNPLTEDLEANGFRIRGLADPEAGQDAVTLDYYESNLPSSTSSGVTKVAFDSHLDYTVAGNSYGLWQDGNIRLGWEASSAVVGKLMFRMLTEPNSGGLQIFSQRTGADSDDYVNSTTTIYEMQNTYRREVVTFYIIPVDDVNYPSYRGTIFNVEHDHDNLTFGLKSQFTIEQY
jgi:hypothetical protein